MVFKIRVLDWYEGEVESGKNVFFVDGIEFRWVSPIEVSTLGVVKGIAVRIWDFRIFDIVATIKFSREEREKFLENFFDFRFASEIKMDFDTFDLREISNERYKLLVSNVDLLKKFIFK